jgi:hypothetical protein
MRAIANVLSEAPLDETFQIVVIFGGVGLAASLLLLSSGRV